MGKLIEYKAIKIKINENGKERFVALHRGKLVNQSDIEILKMVDRSCDEDTERQIYDCVMNNKDVIGIDLLQTRVFGNKIYVDVEIQADGDCTLLEAHGIAEAVHNDIEKNFAKVKHIMVHVNPAR